MTQPYFFGYGSLVNVATHSYARFAPAELCGWRRCWQRTKLGNIAILSAMPDDASTIQGLIAAVPGDDWRELDQREAAYARLPLDNDALKHDVSPRPNVAIYQTPKRINVPQTPHHGILLSYLDVVIQGYLHKFGEEGVARFFSSTSGWDLPVFDDRRTPQYPRHQVLGAQETALVDQHLTRIAARIEPWTQHA